jgi:MFS family permease
VNKSPDTLPPHYRRNFVAFLVDYVCFGVAFNFFSPTSVLPAFVGRLTTSAPLVGMVSTVFRGSWMLPQLAVARLVNDKPRKKPYMLTGVAGRGVFWVIGLALWAGLARHPSAFLLLFFVSIALFSIGDGVSSVAWFDLVARAIPPKKRARLFGLGQIISGVFGIGAGALMGLILDSPRFAFPNDYALIFGLAGVVFIPSFFALFAIREPAPECLCPQSDGQAKGGWLRLLSTDRTLFLLTACRILIGLVDIATPFYVGHASGVLGLPPASC